MCLADFCSRTRQVGSFEESFAVAMDVKHVVASTESDGTVHVVSGDKAVSFPSPILQKLYSGPEEDEPNAGTKRKMEEVTSGEAAAAGSQETDLLILEPWRRQLVASARELIEAFKERADIDLEDCPVLEELEAMEEKATKEKDMDLQRAGDILHAAQMVLFMCDTDL